MCFHGFGISEVLAIFWYIWDVCSYIQTNAFLKHLVKTRKLRYILISHSSFEVTFFISFQSFDVESDVVDSIEVKEIQDSLSL